MPTAANKTRRVAKRKVVPQTGGLFGFFESKPAATDPNAPIAPAPPAAPAPPVAPAAAKGEKKGWFSGWFGSNKTEPAAAATVPPTQTGGKKRAAKKATTKSKSKK